MAIVVRENSNFKILNAESPDIKTNTSSLFKQDSPETSCYGSKTEYNPYF